MVRLRKIFILLIFGFLCGVAWASFSNSVISWIGFFLVLSVVFCLLATLHKGSLFFLTSSFLFFGLCLGLIRFNISDNLVNQGLPDCSPSSNPCSGLIIANPDQRDSSTRLIVRLDDYDTKVLVFVDNFIDYSYGDRVALTGKFKKPENFLTDQGEVFDYKNYLRVRGIRLISYQPNITLISSGNGLLIKSTLFSLRNNFLAKLRESLPEPKASLAGGLVLRDKSGLGEEVEDNFRLAGVSHIVVLSGYNITIIAETVLKFFVWLQLPWSWLFGVISIIIFVVMVGGEASVVRAACMGIIALIARQYGRTYIAGSALFFAGFLMVLWNPFLLVFDLGFQLSFLATLGLIYLSPIFDLVFGKIMKNQASWFGLREIIGTTLGAQLAVYPWLLFKFGEVSWVGFISNIFILPIIPLAMFASFMTGLLGFISSPLGWFVGLPTYFLLSYVINMAKFFAHLL